MPNGPNDVRSFRTQHKEHCAYRLTLDRNAAETHPFTWREMFSAFADVHTWLVVTAQFCSGTSLFGLAYFSPSIVQTLGYNANITQLLTVPPFVVAFIAGLVCAWLSDRYQKRMLTGISTTMLAVIGFALFKTAHGKFGQKYTSLFFLVTGIYTTSPSMISSMSNNTAGHTRRATALALSFMMTNSGGILSTWIFPKKDAPNYEFAANLNLAFSTLTVVLLGSNWAWLALQNKRKVTHREKILRKVQDLSEEEQRRWLGDKHPDFVYTY